MTSPSPAHHAHRAKAAPITAPHLIPHHTTSIVFRTVLYASTREKYAKIRAIKGGSRVEVHEVGLERSRKDMRANLGG